MLFVVTVFLEVQGTYELRKLLKQNNFTIYLYNLKTSDLTMPEENYESENEIISYFDNFSYEFECIYNGHTGFPSQEVFQAIMAAGKKVKNFTIERRCYK